MGWKWELVGLECSDPRLQNITVRKALLLLQSLRRRPAATSFKGEPAEAFAVWLSICRTWLCTCQTGATSPSWITLASRDSTRSKPMDGIHPLVIHPAPHST